MTAAQHVKIKQIPAIIWGNPSDRAYLYVHGQAGAKEEAEWFADVANRHGWQVISIDLPEHGERKGQRASCSPWTVVPELLSVMEYMKKHWAHIALFANSIGAWFSMLSFKNETIEKSLFVSPVLDMERLIQKMMSWAHVSPDELKQKQTIATSFGQTLSWRYWQYAIEHPIVQWQTPTKILCGGKDHLMDGDTVQTFAKAFGCEVTIWDKGEHWFHTHEQLEVLYGWAQNNV